MRPVASEARLAELGIRFPGSAETRIFERSTPIADILAYGWTDASDPAWGAVDDVRVTLLGLAHGTADSMLDRALISCARRLEAAHALAIRVADTFSGDVAPPLRYEPDESAPETQETPRT